MVRNLPRLYVDQPLTAGQDVSFSRDHAHYLVDVMRSGTGDRVLLFNGHDGEWQVELTETGRKKAQGTLREQTRPQPTADGPDLYFAPVKKAGTDFIAEKATELGVRSLRPLMTEFTDSARVNLGRLRAHAIEAAEQCGRVDIPDVHEPTDLKALTELLPENQSLIVADETGAGAPALQALKAIDGSAMPPAFVIGPQGGFSETELVFLRALPFVTSIDLGPRILRAETAAVAALTCWQAARGDWS